MTQPTQAPLPSATEPAAANAAANAVALRPSSPYVRFAPTLTYATRSRNCAMHSSKNCTTDSYCPTSISCGTSAG